ncbi:MAG: hypothetical protein HY824_15460 [Acidobacteria bacterium]|nr:hypothetical protein [Acidobacteriota bacterium]
MKLAWRSLRRALSCLVLVAVANSAAAQSPPAARLLVLLRNASALAFVDPASGTVLGRVPVGVDPHEVAVTPDGSMAFVASPREGISVIDVRAMKELRRISPGALSAPHDVLYAGGKLYFTAEGYKTIGRYDPVADKVEWMLGIGQDGTHLLVLAKDQQTMWVPNRGSNSVSVIDAVAGGPPKFKTSAIPVPGKTPEGIDLSPDGRELWTATRGDGGVSIIDTASRKVIQSFNLKLTDANRLKFTPDGKVLILDGGTGTLVVVDAASRKEIKRLKVADRDTGDGGMFVMPDGSRVYLGLRDDHSVVVVNLKTLETEKRFPMGPDSGPGCINWAAAAASPAASGQARGGARPKTGREPFPGLTRYFRIDATAANGSQFQSREQAIPELVRRGVRSVVNVAGGPDAEAEGAAVRAAGMKYYVLTIAPDGAPQGQYDPARVERAVDALSDPANYPVFMHSGNGHRTAMLWMIKRVVKDGWTVEEAGAEAAASGLINDNPTAPLQWKFAQEYINAHTTK